MDPQETKWDCMRTRYSVNIDEKETDASWAKTFLIQDAFNAYTEADQFSKWPYYNLDDDFYLLNDPAINWQYVTEKSGKVNCFEVGSKYGCRKIVISFKRNFETNNNQQDIQLKLDEDGDKEFRVKSWEASYSSSWYQNRISESMHTEITTVKLVS